MVLFLGGERMFCGQAGTRERRSAGVLDCYPAAQRHRHAAHGACAQQHHSGYSRPQGAHGWQGGSVAAGHRPCRYRDAKRGGTHPPKTGRDEASRRPWPRETARAYLGMEGETRRHHHRAIKETRCVLRLVAVAFHDGRGLHEMRAERVRGSL